MSLTKEQGDEIIKLLDEIRALLQAKRDRWTAQEKQK